MTRSASPRLLTGVALGIAGAVFCSLSAPAGAEPLGTTPPPPAVVSENGHADQPVSAETPGELLDLARWKITLPQDTPSIDGNPNEITSPAITTYQHTDFFRVTDDGQRVLFRAPVDGPVTESTEFPRSELREMTSSTELDAEGPGWSTTDGTHVMTLRTRITEVPKVKQHVVVAQIHDSEDDVVMVRWEFGRLFVEAEGVEIGDLNPNQPLNSDFDVEIRAAGGVISISYNGGAPVTLTRDRTGCYFKAGIYTQSNKTRVWDGVLEDPTSAGAAEVTSLTVTHS